jgi:hypothetical protein
MKNIREYFDYEDENYPQNANEDFESSGFEYAIKNRYPGVEFEFEVDNNGQVTVTDVNTGNFYLGDGEIEYEKAGMGYANPTDPYSEAEGNYPFYDFTRCLNTIMKKIDNNQPDGNTNSELTVSEQELRGIVKEAVMRVLKKNS